MSNIKKEILYRSIHRGCKETDHLIGNYAKSQIDTLNDAELTIFKDLILEDDMEIYDWIMKKSLTPQKYQEIIEKMQIFHQI